MTPKEHVVLGGCSALALLPILGPRDSALFWGASVLIAVDRHWDYVYRKGFQDWSLRRAIGFHAELLRCIERPDFLALNLFHTVEAALLVGLGGRLVGAAPCLQPRPGH